MLRDSERKAITNSDSFKTGKPSERMGGRMSESMFDEAIKQADLSSIGRN